MTPLKAHWMALYEPVVNNLKLDMRMNLKSKKVEIKTTPETADSAYLQKAADFVHAFILGRFSFFFQAPVDLFLAWRDD